jgi:hypothetical protein
VVLVLIIFLSFAAGLGLRWRLVALAGPVAALISGALVVDGEASTDDMHGLGYAIGVIGAVLASILWLLGRWMRNLRSNGV